MSVYRQLIARNLLRVDMINHGSVKITDKGMSFLKNKENIEFRKYAKRKAFKEKDGTGRITGEKKNNVVRSLHKIETQDEKKIFELLKARRLEIAKKINMPPYIIFHDTTLIEMSKMQPQSLDAMSIITGVGQAKLDKYGQDFLNILQNI